MLLGSPNMSDVNGRTRRGIFGTLPLLVLFGAILLVGCKNSQSPAPAGDAARKEHASPGKEIQPAAIAQPEPEEQPANAPAAAAEAPSAETVAKAEEERHMTKQLADQSLQTGKRLYSESN